MRRLLIAAAAALLLHAAPALAGARPEPAPMGLWATLTRAGVSPAIDVQVPPRSHSRPVCPAGSGLYGIGVFQSNGHAFAEPVQVPGKVLWARWNWRRMVTFNGRTLRNHTGITVRLDGWCR